MLTLAWNTSHLSLVTCYVDISGLTWKSVYGSNRARIEQGEPYVFVGCGSSIRKHWLSATCRATHIKSYVQQLPYRTAIHVLNQHSLNLSFTHCIYIYHHLRQTMAPTTTSSSDQGMMTQCWSKRHSRAPSRFRSSWSTTACCTWWTCVWRRPCLEMTSLSFRTLRTTRWRKTGYSSYIYISTQYVYVVVMVGVQCFHVRHTYFNTQTAIHTLLHSASHWTIRISIVLPVYAVLAFDTSTNITAHATCTHTCKYICRYIRLARQNVRLERKIWAKLQSKDPLRIHQSTMVKIVHAADIIWRPVRSRTAPTVRFRSKASNLQVHFARYSVLSV